MLSRTWCWIAGLPLGLLGVRAFVPEASRMALALGAVAGGVLLSLAVSLLARWRDDDPDRLRHLSHAAGLSLAGWPALAAAWLGLAPGAGWLLAAVVAVCALGLVRASRVRGAAGGALALVLRAGAVLVTSSVAVLALAALGARLAPDPPAVSEERAAAVFDLDARVATRPLPRCRPRLAATRVVLERGAHPRLDASGSFLWFDAPGPDGRRQVQRLDRATGEVRCWTCDEAGSNRYPCPSASGTRVVFESDRDRSLAEPLNTELYLMRASGERPGVARRMTRFPGPDGRPLIHDGGVLVWSRGVNGSHYVVSASLRGGHGATFVGSPGALFGGGTAWTLPFAWSPDARKLVLGEGQPLRPLHGVLIDPATGQETPLPGALAAGASASFSADGGWMLLATTEPGGLGSLWPDSFGFLLARLPCLVRAEAARDRNTGVAMGPPGTELVSVDLGELAGWGAPTGITSEPAGTGFVLGQRREGPEGVRERLVEARLDCESPG